MVRSGRTRSKRRTMMKLCAVVSETGQSETANEVYGTLTHSPPVDKHDRARLADEYLRWHGRKASADQ